MQIIVASFAKCGTKTLRKCLEILGYRVLDYDDNVLRFPDEWIKIFEYGGSKEQFRKICHEYDAVCDLPVCYYWEEILEAFPDSKIIFTMRESEEVWLRSLENQNRRIEQNILYSIMRFVTPCGRKFNSFYSTLARVVFGAPEQTAWTHFRFPNSQMKMRRYREHNEAVLSRAPKDRLLVLNFADEWKPLCEFLHKDIPDQPFPRENVWGGNAKSRLWGDWPYFVRLRHEFYTVCCILVAALAFLTYFLFRLW